MNSNIVKTKKQLRVKNKKLILIASLKHSNVYYPVKYSTYSLKHKKTYIMPNKVTAIAARWIIPIEPANTVLENHCIVFENDTIIDIIPIAHISVSYPNAEIQKHSNHVLIPGLVNAHTHAAMNLLKGIADDQPLMEWLNNHIWPVEAQHVGNEFMQDGTELAIAEMLLGGTTCFNDMYFFPNIVAETSQKLGMRAVVGMIVIDFPSAWAQDSKEYFDKGIQVKDTTNNMPLVTTTLAPHAPYTVNDDNLTRIRMMADEMGVPVHMHIHETAHEVSESKNILGKRPLARLEELGLLNPRMIAVHMTQLTDEEIELIAEKGVHVVHCPESNLKLNSGFCPIGKLFDAGINVALGTDGAASNNDLDMLGEIRTAALLGKAIANDATAIPAHTALAMATINGAKALGLEDKIGSLEIGKQADIVAIDLDHVSTQPVYDPIAQLVYSASREQVTDVWVAGEQKVRNKKLTSIDENNLIYKAQNWAKKINSPTEAH